MNEVRRELSVKISREQTTFFGNFARTRIEFEPNSASDVPPNQILTLNGYAKRHNRLRFAGEIDSPQSRIVTVINESDMTLFEVMRIAFFCYSVKVSDVQKVSLGRSGIINWIEPSDFNHKTQHFNEILEIFEGGSGGDGSGVDGGGGDGGGGDGGGSASGVGGSRPTPDSGEGLVQRSGWEFLMTIVARESDVAEKSEFYKAYLNHSDEEYVIDDVVGRDRPFSYHRIEEGKFPLFTHPRRIWGPTVYESSVTFLANYYLFQVANTGILEDALGLMIEMFNSMKNTEMRIRREREIEEMEREEVRRREEAQNRSQLPLNVVNGQAVERGFRVRSHSRLPGREMLENEDSYLDAIRAISDALEQVERRGAERDADVEMDDGNDEGSPELDDSAETYERLLALDNSNAKKVVSEEEWGTLEQTTFSAHKATFPDRGVVDGVSDGVGSCCVCVEQFKDDDEITVAKCAHFYHKDCIKPWFTSGSNKCPLCKQEVSEGVLAGGGEGSGAGGGGDEVSSLMESLRNLFASVGSASSQSWTSPSASLVSLFSNSVPFNGVTTPFDGATSSTSSHDFSYLFMGTVPYNTTNAATNTSTTAQAQHLAQNLPQPLAPTTSANNSTQHSQMESARELLGLIEGSETTMSLSNHVPPNPDQELLDRIEEVD